MLWYHWLVLFVGFLITLFILYSRKYANPYKLVMVFGKKGSGKTTFLTKIAIQNLKRGRPVYSTVRVPGTTLISYEEIGFRQFPPESVLLIDEVGMIWDNRNYKMFKPEVRDWFKLQRHYRNTVYLFSQTFDIDIKLRNLTDDMYLLRGFFNVFSVCRKIRRNIVVVSATADSESRIADNLEFVPAWLSLFGARSLIFTFIPNWVRYFDSYEAPSLPPSQGIYQAPLPPLPPLSARLRLALVRIVDRGKSLLRTSPQAILRALKTRRSCGLVARSRRKKPPVS